jgi:hypothetical protein
MSMIGSESTNVRVIREVRRAVLVHVLEHVEVRVEQQVAARGGGHVIREARLLGPRVPQRARLSS